VCIILTAVRWTKIYCKNCKNGKRGLVAEVLTGSGVRIETKPFVGMQYKKICKNCGMVYYY